MTKAHKAPVPSDRLRAAPRPKAIRRPGLLHKAILLQKAILITVIGGWLVAAMFLAPPALAQSLIVLDEGMVARNAAQTALLGTERYVEDTLVDEWIRLLTKLAAYDGRDLDGLLDELDALMGAGVALGYDRPDLILRYGERFRGYAAPADPLQEQRERARDLLGTYRSGLRLAAAQLRRYAADLDRLQRYKLELVWQGRQGTLDVGAQARLFAAEEAMLFRELMMTRSLVRTLGAADRADRQAEAAAVLERGLRP